MRLRLAQLRLERPRQWGACWLTLKLWRQLGLDEFWGERLPPPGNPYLAAFYFEDAKEVGMRENLKASRITAVGLRGVALALYIATGCFGAATAPQAAEPLACVPARSDDPEPWTWNSRILASFRPDTPKPEFVGAFGDEGSHYELSLWRDSKGVFGELRSPVLEADSPTSRLYDPHFDPKTGTMDFAVSFHDGERRFAGTLRTDSVTGRVQHAGRGEPVAWQRLRANRMHGAANDFYTSRAQFECAMILFRR